jgi:hypothetical protein
VGGSNSKEAQNQEAINQTAIRTDFLNLTASKLTFGFVDDDSCRTTRSNQVAPGY